MKKNQIVNFTAGRWDDYRNIGLVKCLKDFDIEEFTTSFKSREPEEFLKYLIDNKYVQPIGSEFQLGGYDLFDSDSDFINQIKYHKERKWEQVPKVPVKMGTVIRLC